MIRLGIDELLGNASHLLRGRRVGLVSNYTVTNAQFQSVIRLLADSAEWELSKLFGPEHGVKNCAKEGEHVSSTRDERTGLPAYSLYGDSRRPTQDMLRNLDVLVIDLHDIGSRYYTNMNTLAYCMEACAELGLPCVVLDRPNPINGVSREGNVLDMSFKSFVGMHPIPNRHGLTMGELAMFFNGRLKTPCPLTVVPMVGWTREMLLADTGIPFVPSSPNTTSFDMCLLYPGTCLFEGTNLSVGRGTTHPFEYIGAPFVNAHEVTDWFNAQGLPGIKGRPIYFIPNYSRFQGDVCEGIALHVTNPGAVHSVEVGVVLLQGMADLYPGQFEFFIPDGSTRSFIDLLVGQSGFRELVQQGRAREYLLDSSEQLEAFNRDVKEIELYGRG